MVLMLFQANICSGKVIYLVAVWYMYYFMNPRQIQHPVTEGLNFEAYLKVSLLNTYVQV